MSRIVLGMIREDYKNLARSMALSKELTNHSLPEIGMEATPERATPDCPEVVMPGAAGCSASGRNGGHGDGGCIDPDSGLLSLKYGELLRRKEGHFSHVYYSHHFGDSLL